MPMDIDANFRRIMWYIFAGMRGGPTRIQLVELILSRPSNMNQISKELNMDYKTIQHHIKVLSENRIIVSEEKKYGTMFFGSALLEKNKDAFKEIKEKIKKDQEKKEARKRMFERLDAESEEENK